MRIRAQRRNTPQGRRRRYPRTKNFYVTEALNALLAENGLSQFCVVEEDEGSSPRRVRRLKITIRDKPRSRAGISSPDNLQPTIAPKNFVRGYYRYILNHRLGNDLPIERIAMMERQLEQLVGMKNRVRQHLHPEIR